MFCLCIIACFPQLLWFCDAVFISQYKFPVSFSYFQVTPISNYYSKKEVFLFNSFPHRKITVIVYFNHLWGIQEELQIQIDLNNNQTFIYFQYRIYVTQTNFSNTICVFFRRISTKNEIKKKRKMPGIKKKKKKLQANLSIFFCL